MSMREWSGLVAIVVSALSAIAPGVWAKGPNVVMIVSDDHAWTNYSFMGHPQIRTPNIDRLAAGGMTYRRGYVPSSLCCPSLASILTTYFDKAPMLPRLLGEEGYVSFQSGKWWGGNFKTAGFTEGMSHGDPSRGGRHGDAGLKIGRETMAPVLDFMDKASSDGKPFFVWYAPMMPHSPHNPPDRLLDRYRDKAPTLEIAKYWAMIDWFDETCGALLNHLDARGLANDTIVVYLYRWAVAGDRKLILPAPQNSPRARPELYDLATAPTETKNLADREPEKVAQITKMINDWWNGE